MSSAGRVPIREVPADERDKDVMEASLELESEERQPSLLPHLRLLWVNRRVLLRAGLFALLASTIIALLIPARYQSVTRLMPPDGQSGALGMLAAMAGRGSGASSGALGGVAGDLLGVKSSGALFVGILNSESAQDALIDKFQLRKGWLGTKSIEDARRSLAERTDVSEDRKSGIISIGVTDHDPKRAAGMAQAYVEELNKLVASVSTSSARRERVFLEERLQKVKSDLDAAAKNFSDFASKNTAIDIPAQGKAMVEAAAALQGQLIVAQAELSGLQQIYTNNNVRIRAADARVNELKRKLNEIGGADPKGDLKAENSLYPSIRRLPVLGVTYADLYRQTKIQETVYELLTQQYELAKVEEAKEIPAVKVLDPAIVPTRKSFPPRTVAVVLGTMLGITLAMTWIVAKARWDTVDADDPRKEFASEVFATVRANLPRFSRNGAGQESQEPLIASRRKGSERADGDKEELLK